MINLSPNPKSVEQYKYKYFVSNILENKILVIEMFEGKNLILRKKIKIKNLEQIFDFCDCVIESMQALRIQASDRSLDVMAELTNEKMNRIENFTINSSKEINNEIDSKIEEVVFSHEQ